jgi:hypothetical protein
MACQRGRHARFLLESGYNPWVLGQVIDQDLDGKKAAMEAMARKLHLRHAASANPAQDLILASQNFDEPVLLLLLLHPCFFQCSIPLPMKLLAVLRFRGSIWVLICTFGWFAAVEVSLTRTTPSAFRSDWSGAHACFFYQMGKGFVRAPPSYRIN